MISFEVSLGEVAVKRKLKFRQKVALILPLPNNLKSTPEFARVSELGAETGGSANKDTKRQT